METRDEMSIGRIWASVLGVLLFSTAGSLREFGRRFVTSELVDETELRCPESSFRNVLQRILCERPSLCVVLTPSIDPSTGNDATVSTLGFIVHPSEYASPLRYQCSAKELREAIKYDAIEVFDEDSLTWSHALDMALVSIMAQSEASTRDMYYGDGRIRESDAVPATFRNQTTTTGGGSCVYTNFAFDDAIRTMYDRTAMFLAAAINLVAYAKQQDAQGDVDAECKERASQAYKAIDTCVRPYMEKPEDILLASDPARAHIDRAASDPSMVAFDVDQDTGYMVMPHDVAADPDTSLAWLSIVWTRAARPRGVALLDFLTGAYLSKVRALEENARRILCPESLDALAQALASSKGCASHLE